jgi:putative SOS response-associated peptidase YedK
MCGRYRLKDPKLASLAFLPGTVPALETPRWNVAPTQLMPVIRSQDRRPRLVSMRWGLVPFYERRKLKPLVLINARAETALAKPAFRQSVTSRRCAILADGFYEWRRTDGRTKQPYFIGLRGDVPFAFAGIFEEGTEGGPGGFCILTTTPNDLIVRIHDRMPVILNPATAAKWIDGDSMGKAEFAALTRSYPAAEMEAWPVAQLVNSPRNDISECSVPIAPSREDGSSGRPTSVVGTTPR